MQTNWHIRTLTADEQALVEQLATELKISTVSARMLVVRGIRTADAARTYIRPSMDQQHDPYLMRDMGKAVQRMVQALRTHERIMVYGDYDVDGTTAVALAYSYLRTLTDQIEYYIPDRYTEGYGISFRGIDVAQDHGCTLIVALDCGIKSVDKVEYAAARGIDFIICDHHTPGEDLPKAVAVLDAERADNTYPYDKLSGCGVGYKFCQALARREGHGEGEEELVNSLMPLLAMSIASDIVPMTGENRLLAYFGLKRLNEHPTIGIRALKEVAGVSDRALTMTDLVFKIGPRINACGRLYSGREAVKLLITDDEAFAREQAQAVDNYNQERKDYDSTTTEQALEILRQDPDNERKHTTVVYDPTWHKGVVGIAASRLTETYYRPTIVLTKGENGIISGSARSVSDFNIYDAIDSCRDLLTNFGGHAFAAGLSMTEESLEEFKRRFEDYVAAHIRPEQQVPTIQVEAAIRLGDITPQMYRVMECLEPFGPENERPIFVTRGLRNNRFSKRCGADGSHLKLDLTDGTATIGGIAFRMGDWALPIQEGKAVDIAYELEQNTFNGKTSTEMRVTDIRLSEQ